MNADRIVEALLDDPEDYIHRTLPNGYIIRHANHPNDYFIKVDDQSNLSLVFNKKEATVFDDSDLAQRVCANINSQTGGDLDRYEVEPVENEVVEALLDNGDDPKAYIDRTLPDHEPPYYVVKRDENAWFNRGVIGGMSDLVVVAVYRDLQKARNFVRNVGGRIYKCTGKSKSVRAWFIAGNKLSESADDIDPKDFVQQQFPDLPVRIEQVNSSAWRIFDLNGHWMGDLFYDPQYAASGQGPATIHPNWHDIHWFITPADVHKKQAAFRTKHEAIKYLLENDDPEDMVDRVVTGDVAIGKTLLNFLEFQSSDGYNADFRLARLLHELGIVKTKPTTQRGGWDFGLPMEDGHRLAYFMSKPIPVRKTRDIHNSGYLTKNMFTDRGWKRIARDLFLEPNEDSVYVEVDPQKDR